ncbi:unnamed protein product [Trichobilharzia regenti]|nr:unnamed protein product [Trichobilharzia regenti]
MIFWAFSFKNFHFLLSGLDNAGKTTIVKKFNGEDINSISPTLGFRIETLEHMGFKLNIWDVGGQKSLRSYWRNYFETTDALIWVIDSSDCLRLEDCQQELAKLLMEERLTGATLLVFANKQVSLLFRKATLIYFIVKYLSGERTADIGAEYLICIHFISLVHLISCVQSVIFNKYKFSVHQQASCKSFILR